MEENRRDRREYHVGDLDKDLGRDLGGDPGEYLGGKPMGDDLGEDPGNDFRGNLWEDPGHVGGVASTSESREALPALTATPWPGFLFGAKVKHSGHPGGCDCNRSRGQRRPGSASTLPLVS